MDTRIAEAVTAERQRCAAICDALANEINAGVRNGSSLHDSHGSPAYAASSTAVDLSEAIRNPNEIK